MHRDKGFTLIELSIVLVIVGILSGAILAARSMVETARITSLVKQLQQIDIAVANSKTRYTFLPGDNPNLSPYAPFGWAVSNGNGIIEDNGLLGGSNYTVYSNTGEEAAFWKQLQQVGFMPDLPLTTPNFAMGDSLDGVLAPAVFGHIVPYDPTEGKKAYIAPFYHAGMPYHHYYAVCGFSHSNGQPAFGSQWGMIMAYKPSEAAAIDTKMDDGQTGGDDITYNGKVLAVGLNNQANYRTGGSGLFMTDSQKCMSSADINKYNVDDTGQDCCMLVAMEAAQ